MKLVLALATSAAAYGTMVGTEGHGVWKNDPKLKPARGPRPTRFS